MKIFFNITLFLGVVLTTVLCTKIHYMKKLNQAEMILLGMVKTTETATAQSYDYRDSIARLTHGMERMTEMLKGCAVNNAKLRTINNEN